MKHILRFFLFLIIFSSYSILGSKIYANEPIKREFRAAWVSTVYCLDWPTDINGDALQGTDLNTVELQQKRLRQIIETLKQNNFNAVFFQVRPMSDALYRSTIEPTSSYLTGTRGAEASWDPLRYAIQEAHKRGMELHAWVNPYRWAGSSKVDWNTPWDKEIKRKGWILKTEKGKILNPGMRDVLNHIVRVCKEIVVNYDVDGLTFDDYFYNSDTPENSSAGDWKQYKSSGTSMCIADWRRNNVNYMIYSVYKMIQANKPYVRFGVSPAGVASGGAKNAGISPFQGAYDWQYAGIYSDPLAWLKRGIIDYISPQLYWTNSHETNPFGPLTKWWSNTAYHFKRHHYASHSISALGYSNTVSDWNEYLTQIQQSRNYTKNNAPGCVLFRSGFISGPNANGLGRHLLRNKFQNPALPPEITWKRHVQYQTVSNLQYEKGQLSWTGYESEPVKFSIYAIPSDTDFSNAFRSDGDGISSEYLVGVSYGNKYTLPIRKRNKHNYAVCVLDKFGKEYAPQTFDVTGINPVGRDGFTLTMSNGLIRFTQTATTVSIYNVMGICIKQYYDVNEINPGLPDGIYIIKAKSESGSLISNKLKIF